MTVGQSVMFREGEIDINIEKRRVSSRHLVSLVLGDTIVFLLFAALGRMEHRMELELSAVLATAVPFIISWIVIGYFLGAYSNRIIQGPFDTGKRIALVWLITCPVAIVLRAFLLQIPVSLMFGAVTFGLVGLLLLVWRLLFAYTVNLRQTHRAG